MAEEPREYFVSIVRDRVKVGLLVGPYASHDEALAMVDDASRVATKVDPWACFDAFGTCSLPMASGKRGALNGYFGLEA